MVERRLTAEVMGPNPILFFFSYSKLDAKNSASFMEEDVFRRTKGDFYDETLQESKGHL